MPKQRSFACQKKNKVGSFRLSKSLSVALVCLPEAFNSCLSSLQLPVSCEHVLYGWNMKSYKLYTILLVYPNQHFRKQSQIFLSFSVRRNQRTRCVSSLAETCWPRDWAGYSTAHWLWLLLLLLPLCSSHVNSVGQIYGQESTGQICVYSEPDILYYSTSSLITQWVTDTRLECILWVNVSSK